MLTLILSPHPDDAVLSAWTVLKEGDVEVINFFTGLPSIDVLTRFDAIAGASSSRTHMLARIAEDKRALAVAGVTPRNLGLLENQYRGGTDEVTELGTDAPTLKELESACREHLATAGRVLVPAALGGHADHKLVRDLGLREAARGTSVTLYADMPYAVHYGWPGWVVGREDPPHLKPGADWNHHLEPVVAQGFHLDAATRSLTERQRREKLRLVECYETQFPSLNGGGLDRLRQPIALQHEVFWSLAS
jgi:LmbE family N-acetylglucosaminyl deacetylase